MNDLIARKQNIKQKLTHWLNEHLRSALFSLGLLIRSPFTTLLTVAIIGIALALPAGLLMMLNNLNPFTAHLQESQQISLFLKNDLEQPTIERFLKTLQDDKTIKAIRYISRQEALEEFQKQNDQGNLINLLEDNPLPAVITFLPHENLADSAQRRAFIKRFEQLAEVEIAQFDQQWAERLQALLNIASRFTGLLGILLITGVLLIISGMIRFNIQDRLSEIQISRLFGATHAFIRRPFLYNGFWYGLLGGLFAGALLLIATLLIKTPINQLLSLYQSEPYDFSYGQFFYTTLITCLIGGLAGIVSSWLVVAYYQRDLENRDFV